MAWVPTRANPGQVALQGKYMYKACVRLAMLLAFLASLGTSIAQITDGNIVGTITDPTGAAIGDVTLTLQNVATGVQYTAKTAADGSYRFNNVPVGTYNIAAAATGFKKLTQRNVAVELSRTTTVNLGLEVGAVTETIEVTESAPLIDTTSAQVTTHFETRDVTQLPSAANGNLGVLNLSLLGAGVASSGGVGYGTGPSVGGQRPTNNNFMIEGVDNNDKGVTGRLVDVSNEAVASFTLIQNQYNPEFGHSSGGVFNTIVRSGTNEFHGSLYEYFNNKNLNAIDVAFTRGQTGPVSAPRYDENRLGATAGGAIIKNKWFYFGNFEYHPLGKAGTTSNEILGPTQAGYDLLGRIPGLNANALSVLKTYVTTAPTASQTVSVSGLDIPVGAVPVTAPSFENRYNWLISSDYNFSERDQLRGRYIHNRIDSIDTFATLPQFFAPNPQTSHLASLSEFHNFSASVINELRLAFNRQNQDFPVGQQLYPGLDAFPNITLDELGGLNIGPDPNAPQSGIQTTYQLVDNLTWVKGRSTWKFGYDGRKVIAPSFFVQRFRGDYDYSTLERWLQDRTPDVLAERSAGGFPFAGDLFSHYLFANNDFKATRNLTINLGIRWEYVDVPYGSKLQSLNNASSVPGVITFNQPKPQKNNWAPRIGAAWTPFGRQNTVIRAGFGMAYDQVYQNLGTLSLPPQFALTRDASPDAADLPGFLASGGLSGAALGGSPSVTDLRAATSAYVPDQVRPYAINWNIGIQHNFLNNYTLEIRYLGTRGVHLPVQTQLNSSAPVQPGNSLPTYLTAPSQAQLDALPLTLTMLQNVSTNPFAAYGFSSKITSFEPWGNSIYHGLAVQVNRRYSNGLQFQGAYTWSHNIDDSTAAVFSTLLSPRRPQDFQNWRAERSSSALDRRQRFTFTGIYETPWLRTTGNRVARAALGGWMLAGTYTAESPEYATVQSGVDSNLNGDAAGDRTIINPAGQDGVGSGVTALKNSAGQIVAYLADNPKARYIQAGLGAYPNGGRNSLPLPGINNFDLSLSKWFPIKGERVRFQFRADAYNAFNHAQFSPGKINTVELLSRSDTRSFLLPQNPAFNNAETAFGSNPRTIQLVGRIQW